MYIRITRGQFNPDIESDVQRVVEEQVVPALQRLPGFQRYMGGVNRRTRVISAISLWDTEDHANFSRDALGSALPTLMGLGVTLEPAEIYEMTVDA